MKTLRLTLSIVCASLLLISGQVFGQSKTDKSNIMPPVKADNFKEIASQLSKDGWKTASYTIEEQLVSTAKLKGEMSAVTHDALYLWVMEENTAANMADAKEIINIHAVDKLTYQVALSFLSQCQIVLIQKGLSERMRDMNQIVNQIAPMVVQNNIHKSMEIYLEKDKTYTVRTVYMIDKSKVYDILVESCVRDAAGYKENAILVDVFKEALNRMAKQSLR